jgi:hypothetical protein
VLFVGNREGTLIRLSKVYLESAFLVRAKTPRLHWHPKRRSRSVINPLAHLSTNTEGGRFVHDKASLWLEQIGSPDDPLTVAAVVSCAELAYRLQLAHRDPDTHPDVINRLSNTLRRHLIDLGVVKKQQSRGKRIRFTE